MTKKTRKALVYCRTSSLTNTGDDRDSLTRQQEAVSTYAAQHGIAIVQTFYDAGVSGSAPIDMRPAFIDLMKRLEANGIDLVLTENPDRFARDLLVQIVGHDKLKGLGVELVPVSAPGFFLESTPTAELIRGVLGAVSQFERAQLVNKLRVARDRKSASLGRRCEGRKPVPETTVREARRLARRNPKTGKARSYRSIAAELAALGHVQPNSGRAYGPESIKKMLGKAQREARASA